MRNPYLNLHISSVVVKGRFSNSSHFSVIYIWTCFHYSRIFMKNVSLNFKHPTINQSLLWTLKWVSHQTNHHALSHYILFNWFYLTMNIYQQIILKYPKYNIESQKEAKLILQDTNTWPAHCPCLVGTDTSIEKIARLN